MNRTALCFALLLPALSLADVCRNGTCVAPTVVTQTYVAPAAQLLIPTYGVSYNPAYGGGADETNRLLAELLAENRAIRAELQALKAGGGPLAAARDPRPLIKANCARCHTEGSTAPGADFTLFDEKGEPFALSSVDRKAMAKRLKEGTMPPPEKDASGLRVQRMIAADREFLAGALLNPPPSPKPPREPIPAASKLPEIPKLSDPPAVPSGK